MDGLFHGKSHLELDDNWGYPHFRKPPYESVLCKPPHCRTLGFHLALNSKMFSMWDRYFDRMNHHFWSSDYPFLDELRLSQNRGCLKLLFPTDPAHWNLSIQSDILFWHLIWHIFWPSTWHIFWHVSDVCLTCNLTCPSARYSDISSEILFDIYSYTFSDSPS